MNPQDLINQLRAIMEQLTDMTGNKAADTKEPLFYGNGITDIRMAGELVQIGIRTELGWVLAQISIPQAVAVIAQIATLASGASNPIGTQATIPSNTTLH